ncbi:MAG: hypothetical protein P4L56_04625 [Candidatus Sulfopaludibacter sp.]|nr:hypothetical protein [Candidatus Sulfopaludibacter sp.]
MQFTRRELAVILAPAAAAVAQTAAPASPADELKAAQARLKTAAGALDRQALPMSTEPAFQFKA